MRRSALNGRYVWDPAGSDAVLAAACTDLRAGRLSSARAALATCDKDAALRASRSQVLGAVAAASDVAEAWLREEPASADARLLFARVAAARALRAGAGKDPRAPALAALAAEACAAAAAAAAHWDPTPFTVSLSIAHLRRERALLPSPVPGLFVAGPWNLLEEVLQRDPLSREAHHRFLSFASARFGGSDGDMWRFADHVAQTAPRDSVLTLLPLAARVEQGHGWAEAEVREQALEVYEYWFVPAARERAARGSAAHIPVADFSLLAYALVKSGRPHYAAAVLREMSPYAQPWPWSLDGADPAAVLDDAYTHCGLRPP